MAQGLAPLDAGVLGATLHARAGIEAAQHFTDICVTPEDVIDAIPQAIRLTENVAREVQLEQAEEPAES